MCPVLLKLLDSCLIFHPLLLEKSQPFLKICHLIRNLSWLLSEGRRWEKEGKREGWKGEGHKVRGDGGREGEEGERGGHKVRGDGGREGEEGERGGHKVRGDGGRGKERERGETKRGGLRVM